MIIHRSDSNFLQNITIILIGKTETGNRFYITFIRTIVFLNSVSFFW
ncbi:hypothetical protein HMPREF1376_02399 [Enterococcus faecium R446]|nr:hypothetical protein HMPREF1376_02399 [Enterococcus faecium R446]